MMFTNRVRFEAVLLTNDNFVKPDSDLLMKDFIQQIALYFPGAQVSAGMNIAHETFEKSTEVKPFILENTIVPTDSSNTPISSIPDIASDTLIDFGTTATPVATEINTDDKTVFIPQFKVVDPIPTPVECQLKDVSQLPNLNGFTTVDIIDALSRVKEISAWLDQARVVMEDIPKIRNEIKDITENLLKVFQNGQPKNGQ